MAPDIEARIDADFPEGSCKAVRDIFALMCERTVMGYMNNLRDRVARSILYLADGDIGRLATEVDAAINSPFSVMRRAEWEGEQQVRDFGCPPES